MQINIMKYRLQLSGGGFEPKTRYYKSAEGAENAFEGAFELNKCDMNYTRAKLMFDDGRGWLMQEEKFEKDGITQWVEYDFNFEIDFEDGQFLEVSEASSCVDSARNNVYAQYQNDDINSIEYVGWTS